ncbi:cupredoxin domain-containing protein [Halobaculum lipolyticum]|uniref:Plastocyanin/azurin family copper-binding protein n=1 Tax=Halobaculum lipolyticum TaxID=3032001 RepID=A0ABD5WCZ9_9EURY|nr:plastocyanin/azurin family copper-binding protein [Halobaculum sp. DT31]
MATDNDGDAGTDGSSDEGGLIPASSRRRLLKIGGAGAVAAAFGGAGMAAAQQEGDDEDDGEEDDGATGGGSESVLDDLVDPTFGYPLAADESDGVSVERVVDVTETDGAGAHPDFPSEPSGEAPGAFEEVPAEFYFDPVGLAVEPGTLVQFRVLEGLHTVTAFTELAEPALGLPRRVPEDSPPFTSPPLTPDQSWVYQFEESGVYDYFCFPHLGLGMVARIVVYDPEDDDLDDEAFAVEADDSLFPNDRRVLASEELVPENVVDAGEVAWADLTIGGVEASGTPDEAGTETAEAETETEGAGTETEQAESETETETETETEEP